MLVTEWQAMSFNVQVSDVINCIDQLSHSWFSDVNISQCCVSARFRCGGVFNDYFVANNTKSVCERILNIGQYLAKL